MKKIILVTSLIILAATSCTKNENLNQNINDSDSNHVETESTMSHSANNTTVSFKAQDSSNFILSDFHLLDSNTISVSQTHTTVNNNTYTYLAEYDISSVGYVLQSSVGAGDSITYYLSSGKVANFVVSYSNNDALVLDVQTGRIFNIHNVFSGDMNNPQWGWVVISALKTIIVWAVDEYCESQKAIHNHNLNVAGCGVRTKEDCRVRCACGANHAN